MRTKRAEQVIIYIGHDEYRGFGFWWDRLVVSLISSSAGLMVGIGLLQFWH